MAQELRLIPREENYVNPYSRKEKDRANKVAAAIIYLLPTHYTLKKNINYVLSEC